MKSIVKKIIAIVVIVIIVVLAILFIRVKLKKQYKVEQVIEQRYFSLEDNGLFGVSDKNGNIIIKPEYQDIHIPNPSKAIFVCYYDYNEETNTYKTKVINENGIEIFTKYNKVETINLNYVESATPYEKNSLKYEENGKYGIIDLKGNVIVKAEFDSIEGLANKEGELLISKDEKYGVINTKGAKIIDEKYDYISGDGYYTEEKKYAISGYVLGNKTQDGYRYGYMTYKGKILLNTQYNEIIRIGGISLENTDKDIFIIVKKDGQYGLIKNKKTILDYKYQSIDYSGVNNLFIVTRNTKSGVFNSKGDKILSVKYDDIQIKENYIFTKQNNQEAYYNLLGNRVDKSTIENNEQKGE